MSLQSRARKEAVLAELPRPNGRGSDITMENDDIQTMDSIETATKAQRPYPNWVGPIMALFLPGSAHFLSGQRRTGILWWITSLFLSLLTIVVGGIPGLAFFYVFVLLAVVLLLFYITMLISSWCPTRRIGCLGWVLFPFIVFVLSEAVVQPCLLFIRTYVCEALLISGMSMAPTLISPSESTPEVQRNDRGLVSKLLYRLGDPQRGDIVTFRGTNDDGLPKIVIKRIVGLPCETVNIEPPYVLINGKRLTEPPIFEKIASKEDGYTGYCTAEKTGREDGIPLPLTLGPNEYFLLGDNSPRSYDSRMRGPVLRKDIIGRLVRIYFPFDRIRELE